MKTIRVVLYLDASAWAANENGWYATSKPGPSPMYGCRRYQIAIDIPDPRAADEAVRADVLDVTPAPPADEET